MAILALLPLASLGWDAGLSFLGSVAANELPPTWLAAAFAALVGPAAAIVGCIIAVRSLLRSDRRAAASAVALATLTVAGLVYFWLARLDI